MNARLSTTAVEQALQRLGERLDYHRDVELLLVGGAAGMVTGVLPAQRTTTDCDVMIYVPPKALAAVELAAEIVASELGLAGRVQDLEDLRALRLRRDDLLFIRRYLDALKARAIRTEQVEEALTLLESWKVQDRE